MANNAFPVFLVSHCSFWNILPSARSFSFSFGEAMLSYKGSYSFSRLLSGAGISWVLYRGILTSIVEATTHLSFTFVAAVNCASSHRVVSVSPAALPSSTSARRRRSPRAVGRACRGGPRAPATSRPGPVTRSRRRTAHDSRRRRRTSEAAPVSSRRLTARANQRP